MPDGRRRAGQIDAEIARLAATGARVRIADDSVEFLADVLQTETGAALRTAAADAIAWLDIFLCQTFVRLVDMLQTVARRFQSAVCSGAEFVHQIQVAAGERIGRRRFGLAFRIEELRACEHHPAAVVTDRRHAARVRARFRALEERFRQRHLRVAVRAEQVAAGAAVFPLRGDFQALVAVVRRADRRPDRRLNDMTLRIGDRSRAA